MKTIHKAGKRKRAIAKATINVGKGLVRINSIPLENYQPEIARLRITEPLLIAGDSVNKLDIKVKVIGGGWQAQANAARLAIARALVETKKSLKQEFLDYDRHLLVADTRFKEACKPNDSKARAKRTKSYR
jgi:small subunit ribosomal protein S9